MGKLSNLLIGILLLSSQAFAQGPTFVLNPGTLTVGGGDQTISINTAWPLPFSVRWNGQARTLVSSSGAKNILPLSAAELSGPQLATLTFYDTQSGLLLNTAYVPIAYKVAATGIAVDGASSRVYVAVPPDSLDPQFPPNSVVVIDADRGSIIGNIQASGSSGPMAISDDGSTLYRVVSSSTIERIDTRTLTITNSFTLPGPVYGLSVMPGSTATIAVRYAPQWTYQIAVFDNGTRRQDQMLSGGGGSNPVFSPDGKFLFDGNNQTFVRYAIGSTGLGSAVTTKGGVPVAIAGSNLYVWPGTIYDWQSLLPVGNLGDNGVPLPDVPNNRILAVTGSNGAPLLQAFNMNPVAALAQQPLGGSVGNGIFPANGTGAQAKLFRFGADGVVFLYPDQYVLIFHTPLAGPSPSIAPGAVVSSASFQGPSIAPGELVSIFGSGLGPADGASFTVNGLQVVPPEGNVEVWFGEKQGTVLFSYSGQINVIAPLDLMPGSTVNVQVLRYGIPSKMIPVTVDSAAPALFTRNGSGTGPAAIVNLDGSVNSPARPGSIVTFFGTGGGTISGALDGRVAVQAASLDGSVRVNIGGLDAKVLYAGAAPGLVQGVFQLNVQVPDSVAQGPDVAVVVTVGNVRSPGGVTIEVR